MSGPAPHREEGTGRALRRANIRLALVIAGVALCFYFLMVVTVS